MLRSELIIILQQQINNLGDGEAYAVHSTNDGVAGKEIKSVGLDANDNTVIDITNANM